MKRRTIVADSVSDALAQGLDIATDKRKSVTEESRNGKVFVVNGPVLTHTLHPLRRVLFSAKRNANPFFHLFESLWMLGGRNDLPWVAQFNKQMKAYSDDGGETQPAAYGYRWREFFGYDQITMIAEELRNNPGTRRAVLAMWNGGADMSAFHEPHDCPGRNGDLRAAITGSSDVPCNTECYFTIRDGKLYMSVQCRSNDLLWGAHGANAVHFSILLEYMAALVGVEVGEMFQYSWNYHLYDGILKHPVGKVIFDLEDSDRYIGRVNPVQPTPIFQPDTMNAFQTDLGKWLQWAAPLEKGVELRGVPPRLVHEFLRGTATPMLQAWDIYKRGAKGAVEYCVNIEGQDWKIACTEWLQRRAEAQKEK